MILKSGMEHYVLKLYNVYINDDPEFTLTCFTTMSNLAKIIFALGPDGMVTAQLISAFIFAT